jgi:hypothetical protein
MKINVKLILPIGWNFPYLHDSYENDENSWNEILQLQIFPNLVANNYKSHVVVNGVVTFWLISTSVCNKNQTFNKYTNF